MEVYILDSLYRRIIVVDKFESLIWSERFSSIGDFELHIVSTLENRTRFIPGVNLAVNASNRIMTVETVQDVTDDDGRRILKITGPSFENILKQRMLALVTAGVWSPWGDYSDTAANLLSDMFNYVCVDGTLNAGDIISPLITGATDWYPTDTISFPTESIFFPASIQTLYDAMKGILDAFAIGFKIVRHPSTNLLYADIYMGSDRTTGQSTLPAVIFSPDLDNLRNTNRLTSSAVHKNVAYVFNSTNVTLVYEENVDTSIAGFERRVLMVECDDGLTLDERTQKGKDELAKNRMFLALDGQLSAVATYQYEVDYYLGDLVELRDDDGTTSNMQVTEQIFIHDKEGERTYPTLSVNTFIYPGSWIAWDYIQEWDDLGAVEYWEDQP